MADQEEAAKRLTRLTKWFNAVIHGHRELKSPADGNRFLEALCAQEDATKCVECLIAAPGGLSAVAKAFRFSRDSAFLNGPATSVLRHLSTPSLKQLYSGQFLYRTLEAIVEPPTFWNNFIEAHYARILTEDATHAFAWLLLEILCSHTEGLPDVREVAQRVTDNESLVTASSLEVRSLGYKVKHILESTLGDAIEGPGGRHDNDFVDFRKVKLLPTPDEFATSKEPFYRRVDAINAVASEDRALIHLDNQFRLLREDLLGELRHDFHIATGQKKGNRRFVLEGLQFQGIDCGTESWRKSCALKLRCQNDIPQIARFRDGPSRKQYISKNKNLIKHNSLGCLASDGQLLAFATVERDEDLLAKQPPVIVLRVTDVPSFSKVLLACKFGADLQFVQVDTAVFAYEPILKCLQRKTEVPLQEQLLDLSPSANEALSGIEPRCVVDEILENWNTDLQTTLMTPKSVKLDDAQAESLLAGLTKRVSLIQGPPGTGKSFIGALIAKVLHDHTDETILVQTYTNHALDQTLDDFQHAGIPSDSIVRLGSKFSPSTKALTISEQKNTYRMSTQTYAMVQSQKSQSESYHDALVLKIDQFKALQLTGTALLNYLEFSEDSEFFDAFRVPESENGMTRVGRHGKKVGQIYLLNRWVEGRDAGVFREPAQRDYQAIWTMPSELRQLRKNQWLRQIIEEHVSEIGTLTQKYNECQARLKQLFQEKKVHVIKQKRIIGCTTTAAAMLTEELQQASPGIVLVEEAGEILESHTLTAMTSNTKQLILIGDHKQLRPKINNYNLTVEKGDGYNLNMSLFERLVLSGVPHTTLIRQHRMRPDISSLIRSLTYPEMQDAPGTLGRSPLRGFQNSLMFISHDQPELNAERIADRRDEGAKASKENEFEVDMVLKCVRYLGQQGYGTDKLVILTPYLGQLYRLKDALSSETDPVLNDLDSFELIRAGLMSPAAADVAKQGIKISTIDNYQGEESDIVIVSLTRSNKFGDIGFMASPQRVNVLLSRARNALIMVGNADTFMNSRKGKETWIPLMEKLKREGYVYGGFPVKCEQHPNKSAILSSKEQFDVICPDGGCSEPCGTMLNCGQHACPHRCHQLQDHSKMNCEAIVTSKCPKKHTISRKCYDTAASHCRKCDEEIREQARKHRRDHKLEEERQALQKAYALQLAEIQDEIDHHRRRLKDQAEKEDRRVLLAQKKQDLAVLKERVLKKPVPMAAEPNTTSANVPLSKGSGTSQSPLSKAQISPPVVSKPDGSQTCASPMTDSTKNPPGWEGSESKDDWEWQKKFEGAENEPLDSLMDMIGLESVKQQFLDIKAKVDTVIRQNVSLKGERFGAAVLGNPGTGKTTVARLYAKFLVKVGALPGNYFHETSGSSLANEGVSACKAHIDKILEEGGGVFFIDEAYQLVSGNNYGGAAVLDFLLAEIENLNGKIVFVLAGYNKQMEAFFAHNPGIPSRIPIEMEFQDYNDQELQRILCHYINAKYKGNMKVDDGFGGLYIRIVSRRIGRGRGHDGFGNAREVQNTLSQISERQAKRLRKERRAGKMPDDNLLTKEDLIGPEPSAVLQNNAAWAKLQKLIGLKTVKESVQVLLDGIQNNYQRELNEKPLVQYSLNRCFIGSPGTGKTSVAKLYGRILADIGLLSNGEVVVKNPADFVGSALGQSESNTKGILASTVGKVLIIDEAYMLAGSGISDPYKVAVIDTIVAEVQSTPGEDRCVLLLGYKDQMEEMFRDVNPGLARRFPLDSAFVFEDFSDTELRRILDLKLKDVGFDATSQAKQVAMDMLKRARNRPNFGNAGEVDIILDKAKSLHQSNISSGKSKDPDTFGAIDFDPDFDRVQRAATYLPQLFQDVVGCTELIKQLQGYQTTAANVKALGMDPREHIPFSFLFKGPPGTGKTTTAQKMGKVFYDMGFLAQAKVVECSATNMIGEYVGQTGPKVQKLLDKALGKVLFIDEAYRLAEGAFATEAMDELVDCLTKPKYAQKLVTILAGYDEDINRLMSINPGLTSRFPETVVFHHLEPRQCLELLTKVLQNLQKKENAPLDLAVLLPPTPELTTRMLDLFQNLSELKSWGNARDVKHLAKAMFRKMISEAVQPVTNLVLTELTIIHDMEKMFTERSHRSEAAGTSRHKALHPLVQVQQLQDQSASYMHTPKIITETVTSHPPMKDEEQRSPSKMIKSNDDGEPPFESGKNPKRDAGVSDAVWNQLQLDKQAAIAREEGFCRMQEEKVREAQRIAELERAEQAAKDEEERRRLEEERIQLALERKRREEKLAAMERERQKEMELQKKLRVMGLCPMGYEWIKQACGYRCAGGSHFLSDAQLEQMFVD